MTKPFYTYILLCADNSYYTGQTDDMETRLAQHHAGGHCLYTAKRRPVRLVWCETFPTRNEAKTAELQIKGWTRAKKEALIRGDFDSLRDLARKRN